MEKKKNKQKESTKKDAQGVRKMKPREIAKVKKLVTEIGTHKKDGFLIIYTGTAKERKGGELVKANGASFMRCKKSLFITAMRKTLADIKINPLELF